MSCRTSDNGRFDLNGERSSAIPEMGLVRQSPRKIASYRERVMSSRFRVRFAFFNLPFTKSQLPYA
jgi:hypothetical protein